MNTGLAGSDHSRSGRNEMRILVPRSVSMAIALLFALAMTFAAHPSWAQETVKIYRDAIGLGHVYADTDEAVAYGLGRLHFRDRPVRTMANLTRASGRLLATIGQLDTNELLVDDLHYALDRRALRFHYTKHAKYLYDQYGLSTATAEEKQLRKLVDAFVKGVNDERKARGANLTQYLTQHIRDFSSELRYSAAQFDALFSRTVDPWEPIAVAHMAAFEMWAQQIEAHGNPSGSTNRGRLMISGSNSWAVPSGGSDTGHTYIYTDAHQPPEWYVAMRFKARTETLDGGGFTIAGLPFLLMGFGRDVSWAITLGSSAASIDLDVYDGDTSKTPGTWIDDAGSTQSLHQITTTLHYRTTPATPLASLAISERYLDAAGDRWVSAITKGRGEHPNRIYSGHFAFGNPVGPTANDPGSDTFKMLYRFLTATDADDALNRGVGGLLSLVNLNVTFGDDVRAITTPLDRVPYRQNAVPFTANWTNYRQARQRSAQNDGWVTKNGRAYYPISAFPVIRSDGTTPVREDKPLKFWANCNSTPIWLLGLEFRFGEPASGAPFNFGNNDYINPFTPEDYILEPTDLLSLRHHGAAWGNHTIRQEWITTGLKVSWEVTRPNGISEALQRILMTDVHSALPVYLHASGFFDELVTEAPAGALRTLASRLKGWALRLAPYALSPQTDAEDAARFQVFWALFRREMKGPWSRAWLSPFSWSFFKLSDHEDVQMGALTALALTYQKFVTYPNLDLAALKRYQIPFGGPNVPVVGHEDCGHVTGNAWANPPWASGQPLLDGSLGGGRMPMLIRMRKPSEPHHRVTTMTPALPARVNTLPEWTVTNGPNFYAAPQQWASGTLYDLPMTETSLTALGYATQVTRTYVYSSTLTGGK